MATAWAAGWRLRWRQNIRIARKDAGKIGLPEVNLGVLPGTGGTQRLSRLVGKSKAIELMVTGNTFRFEEAQELGIINDIYERDGFMENMMEYAKQFCRPIRPRRLSDASSARCRRDGRFPWSRRWRWSARTSRILFQSEDAKEGLAAYVEKEAGGFQGEIVPGVPG